MGRLATTFVCEVCGDELPCMGFEPTGAGPDERSSLDYPNQLCEWCSEDSKREDDDGCSA